MKTSTVVAIVVSSVLGLALLVGVGYVVVHYIHDARDAPPANFGPAAWNGPAAWDGDVDDLRDLNAVARNLGEKPCTNEDLQVLRAQTPAVKELTVSGPHRHGNLAVFFLHGPDTLKDQQVLTLQEAIDQNLATVHETGLGNLAVSNNGQAPLFIQSGDIVKGGTQDRVLPYDLLVPPQTSRQPLAALCVEQGRSHPRGAESSRSFEVSTEQLPGKSFRIAAIRQGQMEMWSNVQNLQAKLSGNLGGSVKADLSPTSLQLTLESRRVHEGIEPYLLELAGRPIGDKDVIGYAVAINGKLHSADVYASADLFRKLWHKNLKASAVEALAEANRGEAKEAPTAADLQALLTDAQSGEAFQRDLGNGVLQFRQEGQNLLVDTSYRNQILHRSVLVK